MPEGASMRVEIAFRADALEQRGYSLEHARQVVQRAFEQAGLCCTANCDGLTSYGQGAGDFACLWRVIMALLRSDWFPDCAAKCLWYDEDGTVEDLLAQAWKMKQ
mgnify:FL=1